MELRNISCFVDIATSIGTATYGATASYNVLANFFKGALHLKTYVLLRILFKVFTNLKLISQNVFVLRERF